MYEVKYNLSTSWQLVSQFVSWEFCRYMCEQSDALTSELDVLTYFRNMVVERTEKAASDITKHEIIAKFVLEAKSIRSKFQFNCISTLADAVKKICPELKLQVAKLLNQLERLLTNLDWTENSELQEVIIARISQEVAVFTTEACQVLPIPDLLPALQGWKPNQHYSIDVYQSVLKCLQEELITATEAKIIADSLYSDTALKQFLNPENKLETESTTLSESVNLSQVISKSSNSQQPSSPFRIPPSNTNQFYNSAPLIHIPDPFSQLSQKSSIFEESGCTLSQQSLEPTDMVRQTKAIQDLGSLDLNEKLIFMTPNPKPLLVPEEDFDDFSNNHFSERHSSLDRSPVKVSSPAKDPKNNKESSSDSSSSLPLKKSTKNWRKQVRLLDSDEDCHIDEVDVQETMPPISTNFVANDRQTCIDHYSNNSSDTSDIDGNLDIRFLTPTIYKEGYIPNDNSTGLGISDEDTNGSNIASSPFDFPSSDPTFRVHTHTTASDDSSRPPKKRLKTPLKRACKTQQPEVIKSTNKNLPKQLTLRGCGFSSVNPVNSKPKKVATKKVTEKKQFKLFDNDLVTKPADESGHLFQKNPPPKTKQKQKKKTTKAVISNNIRYCQHCGITFRTPLELRKHVFIKHTTHDLSSTGDFSD